MFKDNDLITTLFFDYDPSNILDTNVIIHNVSNKLQLKKFLGKIYTPLRYTYIWDIQILSTFVKIIKFFDLPFRFDLDKNNLWRYNAKPYGTYFDKKKRSFVSFFSMGLKKNIGLSIPFLLNYPSKSNLINVVDWHKFAFLFGNTLNRNLTHIHHNTYSKNLHPTRDFNPKLIPISSHIFGKKFHRCLNLSDIDIDPWVTTSDYRFWTNDIYDSKYKKSNLAKLDFSWGVHKSFITSSFFITSFDTRVILYPELYFKYISKFYNQSRLFQFINIFNKKYKSNFYLNILDLFLNFYREKLNKKLYKFNFLLSNYLPLNINYFYNKNLILFFLLFNKIFYNKLFIYNFKKFLFIYKPSKIMKSILIKNYYYFRSKKYNANTKPYLCFRLHYARKVPIICKYSKFISYSTIFFKNLFRSFYSNYYFYYTLRLKKFWNYFFTFFLQNIKRRFFLLNYKNHIHNNYVYDLLLFLKKFIFFNTFLKRYFNSYSYKKSFSILKKKSSLSSSRCKINDFYNKLLIINLK